MQPPTLVSFFGVSHFALVPERPQIPQFVGNRLRDRPISPNRNRYSRPLGEDRALHGPLTGIVIGIEARHAEIGRYGGIVILVRFRGERTLPDPHLWQRLRSTDPPRIRQRLPSVHQ